MKICHPMHSILNVFHAENRHEFILTLVPIVSYCILQYICSNPHLLFTVFYTYNISVCLCHTVCPANEYVGGVPETCQLCPAKSYSSGGLIRECPCIDGTGRVDENDPSLPCVGESM